MRLRNDKKKTARQDLFSISSSFSSFDLVLSIVNRVYRDFSSMGNS